MPRISSFIIGCAVRATDGKIGSVADLLYDDASWVVRWALVDTGSWLPGRRVLLPPERLTPADDELDVFTVPLTQAQVEASPLEEADLPVSRRYEQLLFSHYQWDPYWTGAGLLGGVVPAVMPPPGSLEPPKGDEHLRSVEHLRGYAVRAEDGEIGHVVDALIDPDSWTIPLLEVSTRNWLPGRKVVIAPAMIKEIDWFEHAITVRQTRAGIEASPDYDPSDTVDRERLRGLFNHYGLPTDWI